MQKSRYYPFERNRYFYGKLLTVRDFESEQKYFNDKRRLLNRLLYGPGVVAGLQVFKIDESQVTVQSGVALDDQGREIVLSMPSTLKLSMQDGFTNNQYEKNVYLCIAYDEKDKEPVHSIATSQVRTDEVKECNRTLETSKLFIKETPPAPTRFEYDKLTHITSVLYTDDKVRVLQSTPKYVQAGDTFTVTLTLEKTLQTPPLSVALELDATASAPFTAVAGTRLTFAEATDTEEAVCRFSYQVQAGATPNVSGKIVYTAEGATLTIGDKQAALVPDVDNVVQVIAEPVEERLLEDYFKRPLDDVLESSDDSCIYLAKINLKKNGPSFTIEQVERVPFGEYVYNSSLLKKMGLQETSTKKQTTDFKVTTTAETLPANAQTTFSGQYDSTKQEFRFDLGIPQAKTAQEQQQVSSGVVEISLVHHRGLIPFTKSNRHFYSEEIAHGLGRGDVHVSVGLVDTHALSDLLNQGDSVYYGDLDVFEESAFEAGLPECSIGIVCYPKKGTFRIGIKVKESTDLDSLTVRWWAVRNDADFAQPGAIAAQETTGTPEQ